MNQNPSDIILEVLTIINYQGNKEETARKFLQTVNDQALLNMIDSLPQEKKTELQQKLSEIKDENSEEYMQTAKEYFTNEAYLEALKKASEKMFAEYLTTIMPTLNNEQQDKLFQFLGSLTQSSHA